MTNNTDSYLHALNWAKRNGLVLHPKIERKSVGGVFGLYANSNIEEGTTYASIPKSSLLNPDLNQYPKGTSNAAAHIHFASKEYEKGRDSIFEPVFGLFDTQEYLNETSVQYSTPSELKTLHSAAPHLAKKVVSFIDSNNALIGALHNFDTSISLNTLKIITLNYASRAMADQGFVPILDCFNHNDLIGSGIQSLDKNLALTARKSYASGEQIFVTYGILDLFQHAINYNYFDPSGTHYLPLRRFNLKLRPEIAHELLIKNLPNSNAKVLRRDHPQVCAIEHSNAYFSINGPSNAMMKILVAIGGGLEEGQRIARALLTQLEAENKVHRHSKKEFKGRLKRFYNALTKEKEIIAANQNWLTKSL